MKDKALIRQIAAELIDQNKGLREAQRDYERMARLKYDLPEPLRDWEWINPVISAAPYNALRGATRALANLNENITIHPATVLNSFRGKGVEDDSRAAARRANEWETVLAWNLDRASRRRAAFRSNVVWGASLYNEVNAQVIHLPTQFKARGSLGGVREKAALRFGDWAFRIVDPKTVAVAYSDYMPERVVGMRQITARALVDFWKDRAAPIARMIAEDPAHAEVTYMEFDFVDYEDRYAWAVQEGDESSAETEGIDLVDPQPWLSVNGESVPFLPWLSVAGGTEIDAEPEFQRKPILFPVRQAEQWAITNILGTILLSMAQAEAAAPVDVVKGPGADKVFIDYRHPGARISLTALQTYERIRRMGLDANIKEAFDRIESAIRTSTVADVLVTGAPAPNIEAGFAYNLQIQTALASLGDVKEIGERFYDRLHEAVLLITHYTGGQLVGYGGKNQKYKKYVIDSEDIDPAAIYLKTELKPDVPADRAQRIQGAATLVQVLQYSPKAAMEFLGEGDPEGKLRDWKRWQLDLADLQGRLDRMRADVSGKYEQDVLAAAQLLVAQQQKQLAPGGSPTTARELPGEEARSGVQGLGGPGVNPAGGGVAPSAFVPEATEEMMSEEAAGIPLA